MNQPVTPLRWDFSVYQNLARIIFLATIITGSLAIFIYPHYISVIFVIFLVGINGINMVAMVRAISRLEAGDEFSIYWLSYYIGSKSRRRSAPSPLSIHRYSLGHLFAMVGFMLYAIWFIPWVPGYGAWTRYIWFVPFIISAGYIWAGYAASFKDLKEQPPVASEEN